MLSRLRVLASRIRGFFAGHRLDEDFQRELASHLDMLTEENIRRGLPPDEARRQARLRLGGAPQLRETQHDLRGLPWLETLLQDVRFGLRMLRKSPGLTFALVFSLALGIGVNAAVFGIVNGFLLRPLPIPHPERIVVLASHQQGDTLGVSSLSYPDLVDFRDQSSKVFSDVFACKLWAAGLTANGRTDQVYASCVTGNYFSALGLKAALGRHLSPRRGRADRRGHNRRAWILLLEEKVWRRSDRDRHGCPPQWRTRNHHRRGAKRVSGTFSLLTMDAYLPMSMVTKEQQSAGLFTDRTLRQITAMARLKPGIGLAAARSSVNVIAGRLAAQYADADKGNSVRVLPEELTRPTPEMGTMIPAVAALFLVLAAMVLLLVCVNVAGILLARAAIRSREMAVRAALGAGRGRLVRQILTEAILLSVLGGAVGVILGAWASGSLGSLLPRTSVPINFDFHFDWRVAMYSSAIVLFAGMVVGLWPALRSARANLGEVLHEGGRSDSAGVTRHRARSFLVALQVAGSLTLLIVAALFVRSLNRAERMYLGFDPNHVAFVVTDAHEAGFDQAGTERFNRQLLDRVRALPGVQSVSLSQTVPMYLFTNGTHVYFEGRPLRPGQQAPLIVFNSIDPAYFDTMRVPLLRGRSFTDSDRESAVPVVIVNQTIADEFWPGEDPIGKRFSVDTAPGRFIPDRRRVGQGLLQHHGRESSAVLLSSSGPVLGSDTHHRVPLFPAARAAPH